MRALAKLTAAIESRVTLVRAGSSREVNVVELVPEDIILLVGSCKVPANVMWLSGNKLQIDIGALTSEPLPRKYPSDDYGTDNLAGTEVKEGEAYVQVLLTGESTEIGQASKHVFGDRTVETVSLFEQKVTSLPSCMPRSRIFVPQILRVVLVVPFASVCILLLHRANVSVKMITGDDKNIAVSQRSSAWGAPCINPPSQIETGHLINLGTAIHDGGEVQDIDSEEVKDLIWHADGFAGEFFTARGDARKPH